MPVEVVDESGSNAAGLLVGEADAAATAILSAIGSTAELCVLLVGDTRMQELNRTWRGKDAPTDVLSFSPSEGEAVASPVESLGDVVISVDTLQRQAADGGWSDAEELVRLVLHGVLHLAGFDHERDSDAARMRAEEERIVRELERLGIRCAWEGAAS